MEIYKLALLLCFLLTATIIDIKTRKIPNILTFLMLEIGIISTIYFSPENIFMSLSACSIFILISLLPGIGMGDIKLLMGMSWFIEPVHIFFILAAASILVVIDYFFIYPYLTIHLIRFSGIRLLKNKKDVTKTKENSVAFAPYLLAATILIEGGFLWKSLLL